MFPIDDMTLDYLRLTGRTAPHVKLVEEYAKMQGLFRDATTVASYDETIELDLSHVEPSLAGPKRSPNVRQRSPRVWTTAPSWSRPSQAAPTHRIPA